MSPMNGILPIRKVTPIPKLLNKETACLELCSFEIWVGRGSQGETKVSYILGMLSLDLRREHQVFQVTQKIKGSGNVL